MYSKVTSAPVNEPVSIRAAKAQLNIDESYSDDDAKLTTLIQAARIWMERRLGQSLITQTRRQYMDTFPCGTLEILYGPILLDEDGDPASFAVKYFDSNDVEQTWSATNYWLSTNGYVPKLVPKYSWPSAGDRPDAIYVEYQAGYGSTDESVPANIRQAILLIVAEMYTYSIETVEAVLTRVKFGIETLIASDVRLQYTGYGQRY